MIRTLADIQEHFRRIAAASPDIADVVVGDSEEIISLERSRLTYPLLWLETPQINWSLENVGEREYTLFFVVLINVKPENWQHQNYILHRTLEITNRILTKLRDDHREDILKLGSSAQSDPIMGWGTDFDYGYRTRISIQAPLSKCEPCHFSEACPASAQAAFTWSNQAVGNFSSLVLTDESNYAELSGWTATWRWQIDDGETQSSSSLPGPDMGAGYYMLLWLEISRGDCTLIASAYITATVSCAESVPFLLSTEYC